MTTDPTLSPRFQARLPELVVTLLTVQDLIQEPIRQAEAAIAELQDFVAFEIDKFELARQHRDLSPEGEAILKRLKSLQRDYPVSVMQEVNLTIEDLWQAVRPLRNDPNAGAVDPIEAA